VKACQPLSWKFRDFDRELGLASLDALVLPRACP
jgi:hypothetical protein